MTARSPDISGNVFLAIMLAISNSSESIQNQQFADAKTTINYGTMEDNINNYWYTSNNSPLKTDISKISGASGDSTQIQQTVATWSSQFQADSAVASAATSKADSLVQMSNSQSNTDATNIQQINQLGQVMNIIGYIANLLSH
jgi:hypothetical protein